jgi:hypothetical protein
VSLVRTLAVVYAPGDGSADPLVVPTGEVRAVADGLDAVAGALGVDVASVLSEGFAGPGVPAGWASGVAVAELAHLWVSHLDQVGSSLRGFGTDLRTAAVAYERADAAAHTRFGGTGR